MNGQEYSLEAEIADVSMGRPHVVILGAGASRATLPDGDAFFRHLPVMDDLVVTCGLSGILSTHGIEYQGENFEDLYSNLFTDESKAGLIAELEERIRSYFGDLYLPDKPTIYDHLVLGLRIKDVIATFNWDPLLWLACARCRQYAEMPRVLFLHGNVAIGICNEHEYLSGVETDCPRCGKMLSPSRLLYPIKEKDYNYDPYIASAWRELKSALEYAYILTVFGYGAPASDIEAIELMKQAWGEPGRRNLEQTEIIDVKDEYELLDKWDPFICENHHDIRCDFYNSWVAKHPRRSCEAVRNEKMEIQYLNPNPIPREADFAGLVNWLNPLIEAERRHGTSEGEDA